MLSTYENKTVFVNTLPHTAFAPPLMRLKELISAPQALAAQAHLHVANTFERQSDHRHLGGNGNLQPKSLHDTEEGRKLRVALFTQRLVQRFTGKTAISRDR